MNQLATQQDEGDYFSQYGEQAAMRSIVGKLLKFSKGDYLAGEDNDPIDEGTELIANLETLSVGWIKWQSSKPVEQVMGLVTHGHQPSKRDALDATDETLWEVDEKNQPRDPWQFTNQLILKVPGGDQLYTFSTSSRGGIQAIGELCKIYGKERRMRPDELPIIQLNVGAYQHSNKALGRIKFPVFKVTGWASKGEFEAAQTQLALENEAPQQKALPKTRF